MAAQIIPGLTNLRHLETVLNQHGGANRTGAYKTVFLENAREHCCSLFGDSAKRPYSETVLQQHDGTARAEDTVPPYYSET